jgi:RNA:NAD 2'-phosphotransferase (TPT1/KptA family)
LDAHGSGVTFFQADDERFLVNHIPPEFIADE